VNPVALFRRLLWWLLLTVAGGVRMEGSLPRGCAVLVANHSSHLDTAALLATVDTRRRPRVAAAADYWFTRTWRAAVCRMLAGGFPVRRHGGGSADLAAAARLLRQGRVVVVFPEGTRSRDGTLADFRNGAARLAASAGVPLVPVALIGTAALLPTHGRLRRGRVRVRIGTPVTVQPDDVGSATVAAREQVVSMLDDEPKRVAMARRSVIRDRVAMLFSGGAGVVIVGAWSFTEAISWPLLPEVILFVALLAAPARWGLLVLVAILGSVCGGMVAWTLGLSGVVAPQPLVTEPMRELVVQQVDDAGAAAMREQPLSGVPYKVYAAHAGQAGVDPVVFATESLAARGVRIGMLGVLFAGVGAAVSRRPRLYPWLVTASAVVFAVGLAQVVTAHRDPAAGSLPPEITPAQAELGERLAQQRQREADDGVVVAFHAGDERPTEAVDGERPRHIAGFAGGDVGVDLVVVDLREMHDGGRQPRQRLGPSDLTDREPAVQNAAAAAHAAPAGASVVR